MTNVDRYAAGIVAGSPEVQAYRDAKYAYEQALAQDVTPEIRAMLREELDQAVEACESEWRVARAEARDHYD